MHAILYAYDFFLQQYFSFPAFKSAMFAEQLIQLYEQRKLSNIITTNLILQPTTFLNPISTFTNIGQLNDGWNYQKLPKSRMIFSKKS